MHVLSEHESNFNLCKVCKQIFSTKGLLDKHIQDKHDDSILGESEKENENGLTLQENPMEDLFGFSKCRKTFSSSLILDSHFTEMHRYDDEEEIEVEEEHEVEVEDIVGR